MKSCWICEGVFGPKEIKGAQGGARELQTFKGYTVDFRLQQFRNVPLDAWPEFIEFDSPEGEELCKEMHEEATKRLNDKFGKEVSINI